MAYVNAPNAFSNHCFNSAWNSAYGLTGTEMQLGSGTTAAMRTDYAIETALGSAPESGRFSTTQGSYNAGYVSFAGAITAGGSGMVNETGFFGAWNTNADNNVSRFMLFRDILGSSVNYTAGNILNCSYSIAV